MVSSGWIFASASASAERPGHELHSAAGAATKLEASLPLKFQCVLSIVELLGFDQGFPGKLYTHGEAEGAIADANKIIEFCRGHIPE